MNDITSKMLFDEIKTLPPQQEVLHFIGYLKSLSASSSKPVDKPLETEYVRQARIEQAIDKLIQSAATKCFGDPLKW